LEFQELLCLLLKISSQEVEQKQQLLAYAGVPTPGQVATEEYTGAGPVTRTITAS
jgi:hypothetical protein